MEETRLFPEGSSHAASEDTLANLDQRISKSCTLASEVKYESKGVDRWGDCSTKSQIQGVKRKSLAGPEQGGFETRHYRGNGRASERLAEEASDDDDPNSRRIGENGNADYTSRSEKRLKLKSSITIGTKRSDSDEVRSNDRGDGKGIDFSKIEKMQQTGMKDEKSSRDGAEDKKSNPTTIVMIDETPERWKSNHHHGYVSAAEFDKSRMTRSRSGREHKTEGHSKESREDVRRLTTPIPQGGNPKLTRDGIFERNDLKWSTKLTSVDDSKKRRDDPKRRRDEDRVREQSARDNKVFFDDHDVGRRDERLPRNRTDKHGELEEEHCRGRWDKPVFSEANRKHRDSWRHHGKDIKHNGKPGNGYKSYHQHGMDGLSRLRASKSHFQFHRLSTTITKRRSQKERYFKGNSDRMYSSRRVDHDSRKIEKARSRFFRQPREARRDFVSSEDQKCGKEKVEHHSSRGERGADQPGSADVKVGKHGVDQKSGEANVNHPRRTRGTDEPERVEQRSEKENIDLSSRAKRGTDQEGSIGLKVAGQEVHQKSGEETVDASSRGMRGADKPRKTDSKVARHEVDQKSGKENDDQSSRRHRGTDEAGNIGRRSDKENADHSSREPKGTDHAKSVVIKELRHEVDPKSGKQTVDDSSRGTRGIQQSGNTDIKIARHEVDQKSAQGIVHHSSRGSKEIDEDGSLDPKSREEDADHLSRATKGTNQVESVDIKDARHDVGQKENAHHASRPTKGTDQAEEVDIKEVKHGLDQKLGKENVDNSSRGARGTDHAGSIDTKMGWHDEDQKSNDENVNNSSIATTETDQPESTENKVTPHELASQVSNGAVCSKRRDSTKVVVPSLPSKEDEERITDQTGEKGEKVRIEAKQLTSRSQENNTMYNTSKMVSLEVAESHTPEEPGGTIEASRQTALEVDDRPEIVCKYTLHKRTRNQTLPEVRKRKNRAETGGLRVKSAHQKENLVIQDGQESKTVLEGKGKDDLRTGEITKQKSSRTDTDVRERRRKDNSRAPRKSDEELQPKREKSSSKKKEKSNESSVRRQAAIADRYKCDVYSEEHRHHKKRRGRSHSVSPKKHKHFLSPKKVHGKSTSPGRSGREKSSDWEKFERERERHKTLASFDSRYRRFGGGTSGLGGYSPRRRRSEAAVKTPSPPPRSPDRKKEKTWDSVPPGVDSSVIAAISAAHQAHQAAVQHALAQLATVHPLVPTNILIPPVTSSPLASRLTAIPPMLPSFHPQIIPAVTAVALTQASRPLRRLYVGNVPSTVSDGELLEFMNATMLSASANHLPGTKPCINCSVNVEKNHAFAEFITPEDATAALAFDGVTLHGATLKIRRPKDFVQPSNGGIETVSAVPAVVSSSVADSPHKVFVGGIPSSLTADKVREIVTAFGQLKAYRWEVDNKTQPPQAFAFLEYVDPTTTLNACAGLNGMKLGTGVLTVVQATPDAVAKNIISSAPFYGIPEHAKPLLEPPSCVVELSNLVTAEEVPNMSKEDIEELIEDVRLECIRFGDVKSSHMVHNGSHPDVVTENAPSLGTIKGTVTEVCREEHQDCIDVQESAQDNCVKEVPVEQTETIEGMPCGPARLHLATSVKHRLPTSTTDGVPHGQTCGVLEKTTEASSSDRNESSGVDRGISEEPFREHINERQAGTSEFEETLPPHRHDEPVMHIQQQDVRGSVGMTSGFVQNIDVPMREWQISHLGKVYVEFSTEESACRAAHALHGRLFDGHKVTVRYFPIKLYQERFHKGVGPRPSPENRGAPVALGGHLSPHTQD